MTTAQLSIRLFEALGFSTKLIKSTFGREFATKTELTPLEFLRIVKKINKKSASQQGAGPDAAAWERMLPSTWQGTMVREMYSSYEDEFPPDENSFTDEEAQNIARRGQFLGAADGACLFCCRQDDDSYELYQLMAEEPPLDLGSFASWLQEAISMAESQTPTQ